jgi:hypothetical protein
MTATGRILTTSIPTALIVTTLLFAQVPAGVPYEPKKHPNPIVTWVNEKDFQKSSFLEAADKAGVELMSLSRDEGARTTVEIAVPSTARQKLRIVDEQFEVTFYPVVRQNYTLKSGKMLQLYTFRFPRALTTADVLNRAAFGRPPRGATPRFGPLTVPDRIDIRDVPGLYFDDGKIRTVYWFELGAGYSITTDASKDELLKVLDDLL